jgi:hypothetical protein
MWPMLDASAGLLLLLRVAQHCWGPAACSRLVTGLSQLRLLLERSATARGGRDKLNRTDGLRAACETL